MDSGGSHEGALSRDVTKGLWSHPDISKRDRLGPQGEGKNPALLEPREDGVWRGEPHVGPGCRAAARGRARAEGRKPGPRSSVTFQGLSLAEPSQMTDIKGGQ